MVRASRHRRDLTMSVLLLTIVVVFIVCNIARVACNMYEAYQMLKFGRIKFWPEWIDVLSRLNHVLLSINSSINIVIYTAKVSVNYSFLKLPSNEDHITNNPCYYLPHTTSSYKDADRLAQFEIMSFTLYVSYLHISFSLMKKFSM